MLSRGAEGICRAMRVQRKQLITEALKATTIIATVKDLIEKQEDSEQKPDGATRGSTLGDEEIEDVQEMDSTLLQVGVMPNGDRQVPVVCIVSLCPDEVGDSVSFSSFENCVHAFHTECAVAWLSKKIQTLCPCCRQEFCHIDFEPPIRADEAALFRQFRIQALTQ
jgi:Anaphase-promoting complex subunit 11 RING-H2 finger